MMLRSKAMWAGRFFQVIVVLCGLLMAGQCLAAVTITYTYDDLNRLTDVVRSDGASLSYSYDEITNFKGN